jgi:predicted flap endonuclease-1-like 5' DNA nuclease
MMKVLRVFFLGLAFGWFMKYILDEIFVKDNLRMITNENMLLRERIKMLEARSVQRAQATPSPVQRAEPIPAPVRQPAKSTSRKDDLKLIRGIGPQLEKKLNTAGVYTFEQMSRLTTADLQAILGISKRGIQNADNLITQARKFTEGNTNK